MRKQIIVLGLLVLPALSAAQQRPGRSLSLQEAIRLAADGSEQVTIARAGIRRATGEQYRARSEYLPQLGGSLSYTRTLQTEFSALSEGNDTTAAPEACSAFNPNRLLPISERVDSLESALRCRDDESPFGDLFSNCRSGAPTSGIWVWRHRSWCTRVAACRRKTALQRRASARPR
jgi:hypothetical protein